jgi:branched-chain amino acid transport system substrate-binding protein
MNQNRSKKTKIFGLITISFFIFSAFLINAAEAETKKVLIGGNTALSGPAAAWGHGNQNVWQISIDDINKSGGFTVNGKKHEWELKVYDSAMIPSKAVANTNRLVNQDKAKFIFTLAIECVKAFQPITEKKKVMTVAFATPTKEAINPKAFYTWMYNVDAWGGALLFPWLEQNTSHKRIAILQPDTLTGKASAEGTRFGISKTNLEIVFDEFAPEDTQDFYPILTRMLAKKPDFIDVDNWDPAIVSLIIKQSRELGYKGPLYVMTPDISTLKGVAGWENCNNLYFLPYETKLKPTMEHVKNEYIRRHGEKNWIGAFAYTLYDFPQFLTRAIESTQSFDNTVICKWLENATLESIYGKPAFFGGKPHFGIDRLPIHPYSFARVENGKIVQIAQDLYAWSLVSKQRQEKFMPLVK